MFLLIVVLVLLHIIIVLAIDRRNLVSPLNVLLLFVWVMVIRATELTLLGEEIYPEWARPYMSQAVILETSLVMGLFLSCFLASYFMASFLNLAGCSQRECMRPEVRLPKVLLIVMASIGTACAAQFYSQLTDLTDIILYQTDIGLFEGKGLLISGISLLPAAVLGVLLSCRKKTSLFVVSILLLLVASAVYAPLGQRGNVFTFVILCLSVWIAKLRKVSLKWAIATGIVVLFCAEALVIWRTTLRYGYQVTLSDIFVVADALEGMDRGDFEGLAGLVAYNASIGYDSWWKFFEQLVPRSLMPSKGAYVSVSYLVNQEITGSAEAGLTASVIGTFFAQGGLILVAIGALFMGALVRLFQSWSTPESQTPNGPLLNGLAIAFVLFLTRNGDLTNVLVMLISNLAGVFLLMGALTFLPFWRRTWQHGLASADTVRKSGHREVIESAAL